jgi:uncharacterized protein YfaS (alpha-2-macroglobulin family)
MERLAAMLLLATITCAMAGVAASEARVEAFSPQGEAKGVRQVAVRFGEAMVAFGDPRLSDPFVVRCEGDPERLKGRGRWTDPKNWVYDFAVDLPAGQRCRFALAADLRTFTGQAVGGRREWSFHTGGPAIIASLPREAEAPVDEEQVFLLAMDAPVDGSSLTDAWCEAAGINERLPMTVLPDKESRAMLAAQPDGAFQLFRAYFDGAQGLSYANFKVDAKRFKGLPVIGVRCARRLPAGAEVALVLGANVKSATGIARSTAQRIAFVVRPAFSVSLHCQRVNQEADCLPVTPIRLSFSAPVPRAAAAAVRLYSDADAVRVPTLDPNVQTVESVEFAGPFPERTRYRIELPASFRDDAGREPQNKGSFPLATATDAFPPLAKFPGRFGILELNADPLLPVTLRGIEAPVSGRKVMLAPEGSQPIPGRTQRIGDETRIIERFRRFLDNDRDAPGRAALKDYPREGELPVLRDSDASVPFELPRPGGEKAMEVVGIALPKPGFYIVELASPRLGRALHGVDKPYYVSTSVLVTNLAVHLKHGRESSLAWVTSLDRGQPVPGARVTVRDCTGKLWFEGATDASGIVVMGDALPGPMQVSACKGSQRELIAFARLGEDLAFTYSSWSEGIEPWNFNLPTGQGRTAPLAIHTVFDRTLLRAGETASMKHIARAPTGQGFAIPAPSRLPTTAEIEHLGSGQKVKLQVRFDAQGVAESSWRIPRESKLGAYRLLWPGREIDAEAEFRVEAFRVPTMRAVLAPPREPQVQPRSVKVEASIGYLSGGAAAGLPVRLRWRVEDRSVAFADYADFRFNGQVPGEGVRTGPLSDTWANFESDAGDGDSAAAASGPTATRNLTLDAAGTAAITIDKLPAISRAASLAAELEYSDASGERLAVATRVPLHPAAIYVGIKPEGWAANSKAVRAQVVVVDAAGKALAGREVNVETYESKTYSNRRRILGGFYAYDSVTETRRIGARCSGTTDTRGLLFCTVNPGTSGELILVARGRDEAGRESVGSTSVWVRGDGEWWFEPADHDRIDLIPEKQRYEPGETARFQVRMPFREATVLVTVEREGVLAQQVVRLNGKSPVIDVPVLGSYGPNVFVSALAVRGRVDPEVPGPYGWLKRIAYRVGHWLGLVDEVPIERDTRPTALVDLAKPAYKLGMAQIKVGRRDFELDVKVTPDRENYRVRETARISIEVKDAAGKPAANGEVALAAVDEGLLELMPNASWNILDGLLGQRPVEVSTATAQGRVIGKRHFGRKALPPGGGGGRGGTRELFDTLLLWKGRVALDAAGRATVDVPLNDSLSSFRIVAIAQAGADRFGDGRATVRATQDLMLLSGLPPLVRERDEFAATFTLRNTTNQGQTVQFDWAARDRASSVPAAKAIAGGRRDVVLAAGEARTESVTVMVPVDIDALHWEVGIAGMGSARDRLRVTQKVVSAHPVRTLQATLLQLDRPFEAAVEIPAGALPGRGGVRVEVAGTLASALSGVRDYFQRYPYGCIEQRASVAIGLGDAQRWQAVAASLPSHLDADGLARYFATDALAGSDVLTAYLLQIGDAAGRDWPEDARERMLNGLEAFVTARIVRGSPLPTADLTLRKLAAIEALARHGRARPAMLDSIMIDPPQWPTSALLDWIGILDRVEAIPRRDERRKEALGLLRARLAFQGTAMTLSTERNDALWWLMVSGDVNANRALLAVLDQSEWRDDLGRMLRGTLARQQRGHWGTTVANAWGTVAITKFTQKSERVPVTGTTTATLAGRAEAIKVSAAMQARDLPWPPERSTLSLAHVGNGAPWALVQSRAALPLREPLSAGYALTRTITPIDQKDASRYSRGDVYRVSLDIDAQADMTWVVVDDPIPSGAAILGSGLARDAGSLAAGERREGSARPSFVERGFESYRAYYEFVPKGRFKLEYTVRLNNAGRFELPDTRVEAMYAPERFGALPNASMTVAP